MHNATNLINSQLGFYLKLCLSMNLNCNVNILRKRLKVNKKYSGLIQLEDVINAHSEEGWGDSNPPLPPSQCNYIFGKGTASVISSDSPCIDGNTLFTPVLA